jgi:antagonist of KipI
MIHVVKPGLLTTVQDLGRHRFAHIGVSAAGAADNISFRVANLLVGNDANAPALEITLLGPTIEFDAATMIAISGSQTSTLLPMHEPFEVAARTRLAIGSLSSGARAYLAVGGGVAVPDVMRSWSTFLPGRFGGVEGRALKAGDILRVGEWQRGPCRSLHPDAAELMRPKPGPIRATPSLQADWFAEETIERFYRQAFTVSEESNRSGLRLIGEPIFPIDRRELLTEGIALGSIQIPHGGQPIILFVDQHTTGGYPKIANVIAADIPRVAQFRPRDEIKFQAVTIPEAIEMLRQQESLLQEAFA